MPTYAILNRNPDQDLATVLKPSFPEATIWSAQIAFVRDVATAAELSNKLGIRTKVGDVETGHLTHMVVIEVAPNYWGYTDASLWTWLKASFEASP